MRRIVCIAFATAWALFAWDQNTDLLSAARSGDLAAVKASVEKGADLETKTPYGQTPLYLAAMNGHSEVAAFLLDKGASAEVRDTFYKASMLAFVIQRKHYGIAKMLIAKSTGNLDETLLGVATDGNAELVQAVLDRGKISQDALDKSYEGALAQKKTAAADLLLKAGAHPPAPAVQVDPKVLESYVGSYRSEQYPFEIKFFVKAGRLFLQASGQPEVAPKAKSSTLFEFAPARLEIEFDSSTSFTLRQFGRDFKFNKVVAPQ